MPQYIDPDAPEQEQIADAEVQVSGNGHNYLAVGGDSNEGIPQSGKHRIRLPDDLRAHGSNLWFQSMSLKVRLYRRTQMLLSRGYTLI